MRRREKLRLARLLDRLLRECLFGSNADAVRDVLTEVHLLTENFMSEKKNSHHPRPRTLWGHDQREIMKMVKAYLRVREAGGNLTQAAQAAFDAGKD